MVYVATNHSIHVFVQGISWLTDYQQHTDYDLHCVAFLHLLNVMILLQ